MKTITYDETKWKLVPIEPTEEMIRAALDCQDADPVDGPDSDLYHWYKAMLLAAPVAVQSNDKSGEN